MKLIQLAALRKPAISVKKWQKITITISGLILYRFHQKLRDLTRRTNFSRSLHKLAQTISGTNSIKSPYKLVRLIFKLVPTNFCIKLIGIVRTIVALIFFVDPIQLVGTNFKLRFPYFYINLIQLAKSSRLLNLSLSPIEIGTLQASLIFYNSHQKISPFRTYTKLY